jgi:hypothetical protein
MPVVRAIRTMTKQFPGLKETFIRIMEEELDRAYLSNVLPDGLSPRSATVEG